MQAAYIEELGPPSVIRHGSLPAPVPGPTDVLVDVLCTTVNPVDGFVRAGAYRTALEFPFVVGRDLVGRVATARPGFDVGDLVWCNSLGHDGRQGAAAEQAVVPAASVRGFVISRATTAELAAAARTVNRLMAQGRLRTRRTEVHPLRHTADLHARLESGDLGGRRVVVHVTD